MLTANDYKFFRANPTLAQCQAMFPVPMELDWESLLHVFVGCYTGYDPIPFIRWFLSPPHSISIEQPCRRDNGTPLMMAGYNGNISMIRALVACGANVNAKISITIFDHPTIYRYKRTEIWTVLDYTLHDKSAKKSTRNTSTRKTVLCLLDLGARECRVLPEYGQHFLDRKARLKKICIIILGMRYRRHCYFPFDRWLLVIIARFVWTARFNQEGEK